MLELIFFIMVFTAGTLLVFSMVVPVFGESKQTRKRLKNRLREISNEVGNHGTVNLLHEQYIKRLP